MEKILVHTRKFIPTVLLICLVFSAVGIVISERMVRAEDTHYGLYNNELDFFVRTKLQSKSVGVGCTQGATNRGGQKSGGC